jgi:hypothetical protein
VPTEEPGSLSQRDRPESRSLHSRTFLDPDAQVKNASEACESSSSSAQISLDAKSVPSPGECITEEASSSVVQFSAIGSQTKSSEIVWRETSQPDALSVANPSKASTLTGVGRPKSNIWERIMAEWQPELNAILGSRLNEIVTFDILQKTILELQKTSSDRVISKSLSKMQPFFNRLNDYSSVLGVFAQAHPVTLLLWGGLKTLLLVCYFDWPQQS